MALFRETETVRRELGAAMCRLLHSALPCSTRNPRLFRTKYTEEVDLRNLEKCLVAAANKVVTFSTTMTPRDYDLRPAQPSAAKFLDILMQVQFLVSNLIELALAECDREALSTFSADSPPVEISISEECARETEVRRKSVGKNLTSDSFETKTAALRVRRQSRPNKDNARTNTS
ncbi:WD repeat and FYVE domain-containing protein 3 [Fasciola gigantica]|uniref:WD repeat and FYVE domain-containing protein 3 n=1 Tax=Fasciola gigantica TaxID=46835 RepID=A0A504Y669_FASGI|nr:WD repeat and FYVE domain-containing protein 3 [Fasciola gigantica]